MKTFLNKLFRITGMLSLLMVVHSSFGQNDQIKVSGTITAVVDGMPLPGSSVVVKGTSRGVVADFDGNFAINAAPNETLVFSYVGFNKQEIPVGNQTTINVALVESSDALDEVVVTGYVSQDRKSITGAISSINSEDMEKVHAGATVSSGLAGKIPGVSFRMADGRPGASASIQIRKVSNWRRKRISVF